MGQLVGMSNYYWAMRPCTDEWAGELLHFANLI